MFSKGNLLLWLEISRVMFVHSVTVAKTNSVCVFSQIHSRAWFVPVLHHFLPPSLNYLQFSLPIHFRFPRLSHYIAPYALLFSLSLSLHHFHAHTNIHMQRQSNLWVSHGPFMEGGNVSLSALTGCTHTHTERHRHAEGNKFKQAQYNPRNAHSGSDG